MTENYRVIYLPSALEDIDDIYSYIAYKFGEKQVAQKLVRRIYKAVRSLNYLPERYRQVEQEPWASMGIRQFPEGNYIIYYLTDTQQKTVTIYRIAYGGRDIENILSGE